MTEITDADLGADYWATTEQVRDRFRLERHNTEPDHERRIVEATDAIQADWAEASGGDIPGDLPDPVPELLQYATAYEAAANAQLQFSQNVSGENSDDQRPADLRSMADRMFSRWEAQADVATGAEQDGDASDTVTAKSGVIGGVERSPIDRGGGDSY